MYLLHYAGVKLMELNKTFGIKDDTTNNIPVSDIHNDSDMDYLYFTKEYRRSMTRMVQEYFYRIYEIMCPGNDEALLNYVSRLLSELPMPKHSVNGSNLFINTSIIYTTKGTILTACTTF